jgi:hypothetical protein
MRCIRQDPPNVFMATVVCSYQAPAFRASDSPAAWMVRRSLTDSLATVGAVVGGEFDVIGAGMMAPWSRLHCSGSLGWRGDGRPTPHIRNGARPHWGESQGRGPSAAAQAVAL